jgi:hypothetical protein
METNGKVSSAGLDNNNPSESPAKEQPTPAVKALSTINDRGLSRINLFDDKQLIAAENFITKVMRSKKGGIESVNDGLAVLMRAQDLNLPFSTCLEHIHVINGKTGVDVHIIKALLLRAACTWEVTKDYQALYEYTDGFNSYNDGNLPEYAVRCKSKDDAEAKSKAAAEDDDKIYLYPVRFYKGFDNNLYKDYQLNQAANKFAIVRNPAEAKSAKDAGKIPVVRCAAVPVDYVTEYTFTRIMPDGRVMTATGHFSRNEALAAGLFEKDTYGKYARILIGHRAFTYGAREIGSDVLFGVMETTELKIVNGITLSDGDFKEVDSVTIDDQPQS